MFTEYDCVRLKSPLDNYDIPVGSRGVILIAYTSPRIGYEVEFVDEHGKSLGTFTTDQDHLEPDDR